MSLGYSRLSHAGICDYGGSVPDGCYAGGQRLRMKTGPLYKVKISGSMNEPPHHRPLSRLQAMFTGLALDNLETERFNFSWINFGNLCHKSSSPAKLLFAHSTWSLKP
jgi:hypothetical protein